MSTNSNTKGQFAQKTAPTQLDRIEDRFVSVIEGLSKDSSAIHDKLDQIQRGIDQVRTLAHQTRMNSRANMVILNKTLAGVDLLKSGSSFMQGVEQHRAQPEEQGLEEWDSVTLTEEVACELTKLKMPVFNDTTLDTCHSSVVWMNGKLFGCANGVNRFTPADFLARARVTAKKLGLVPEEPKAEPWVPKVGSVVVDVADPRRTTARVMECLPIGVWKIHWPGKHDSYLSSDQLAPATVEEIAAHERSEKLKKLVRGCRVDTPDGEGIYLGEHKGAHGVSVDSDMLKWSANYTLDQLTPLT